MPTDAQTVEDVSVNVQTWFHTLVGADGLTPILMLVLKIMLLLVVCLVVKRLLMVSFSKILSKTRMERPLQTFLKSMCNILLWLVTIIILASLLRIDITPLVAAFGVIGLALSLAVQDSLSNLAGGINILMSKAFLVGDYIEIGEDGGIVHDVGMIHTSLTTFDNRRIMLPNSKVMSARVTNYSAEALRRVDITFSASYDAAIERVQAAMLSMIAKHPKALGDPAPIIYVKEYGDSAISYVLCVWCARDDYWDLHCDLLAQIKPTLNENGLEMTYPHMNVHIRGEKP